VHRGLLCGRAAGRWARCLSPCAQLLTPPCVAADSAGAQKYAPRVYIFGCIFKYLIKGISSFNFQASTTACLCGCSGPDSRQRTAAPPRPGHSLWGYMQRALASASVEVAQTSGGCDSRRRARQEKPAPPARSRQPAAALGAGITALGHRCVVRPSPPPPGGWAAGRSAGKCRQHLASRIAVNGSGHRCSFLQTELARCACRG
jgi:hypothetical protein